MEQSATDRTTRSTRLGTQTPPTRPKTKECQQKISAFQDELASGQRSIEDYLAAMRRHVGVKY